MDAAFAIAIVAGIALLGALIVWDLATDPIPQPPASPEPPGRCPLCRSPVGCLCGEEEPAREYDIGGSD